MAGRGSFAFGGWEGCGAGGNPFAPFGEQVMLPPGVQSG
jgi:hypothetical protein